MMSELLQQIVEVVGAATLMLLIAVLLAAAVFVFAIYFRGRSH